MGQLIIQPSTIDSWLSEQDPNTNYGSDTKLIVGKGTNAFRSVLGFDFSALPNQVEIISAQFMAYVYSVIGSSGRTLWAYRLTRTNWTEGGGTWNKYDGSNNWSSAGGDYTVTDGASVSGPSAGNWANWSVLAQAVYAEINTSKLLHLLLKDGTETANQVSYFYAREYTTDTTKCPKLVLNYIYKNGLWFGHG